MTSARPIWALVPVKRTTHAKQRLAAVLSPTERAALALAMAEDVLTALAATASLDGVAVVTDDPAAQRLARTFGARVITNAAADGYTPAVAGGTAELLRDGAAAALVLPADVPLVTGAEIDSVIAAHDDEPAFTIVPSRDLWGSNCILRSPPESVPLSFGPDSYRRHLAAARAAGIAPRVVYAAGIACDLDTPDDVDDFLAMNAATRAADMLAGLNWTHRRGRHERQKDTDNGRSQARSQYGAVAVGSREPLSLQRRR
jgi:2-phospho-L-lactate guanylyltransferase